LRIVQSISDFPANPLIRTGFVPTLGALHEGHLSLIRRSKVENDRTIVSIFVNPTQFGPNEDFSKYPRTLEKDCELATAAGADIIFAPEQSTIYGENPSLIHVPFVTDLYEGAIRPGHFDGVATIVAKLFNLVSPKNAYFGEKDLQQCAVINKVACDFNFPINIIICDTVREESGLARSSRNAYLTSEESEKAPLLYNSLIEAKFAILEGKASKDILHQSVEFLTKNSFTVDYFDLVDRHTMHPIISPNQNASLIVAAKLGTTRLIDNVSLAR
jgi:pantoate--beta-alanine ligase